MFDRLSPSSKAALESLGGPSVERGSYERDGGLPRAAGPTVVKIKDPLQDVEKALETLDEVRGKRPPSTWLQRNRGGGVGADMARVPVFEGRRCCLATIQAFERTLHTHTVLPTPEFQCEGCGSTYRVEMRVREERRHA